MKLPKFYENLYNKHAKAILANLQRKCKECEGKGYIETSQGMYKDCKCTKSFALLRKYIYSGMTIKHISTELEYLRCIFNADTFDKLRNLFNNLNDTANIDFIINPARTTDWGASEFANYYLTARIENGDQCLVISSKNLTDYFFAFNDDEIEECMKFIKNVDCLLIDDFGSEYNSKMKDNSSFIANQYNAFLMARKQIGKQTIIASNISIPVLKKTYSSEIYSVVAQNFASVLICTVEKKKSEFDKIGIHITNEEVRSCFDDISVIESGKKPKQRLKINCGKPKGGVF